jgi:hypothetical protein
LQYCYFATEKSLKHYFNNRKRRYHGLFVISKHIQELLPQKLEDSSYHTTIYHVASLEKLDWLLKSYRRIIAKDTQIDYQQMI